MIAIVKLLIRSLLGCFRSRGRLEAEVTVVRHHVNILRRTAPKQVRLVARPSMRQVCLLREQLEHLPSRERHHSHGK